MEISTDLRASLKLPALFIVLAGVPLAALGWMGLRLLEQDRALEVQRLRDRLENAATLLTRELERSLTGWNSILSTAAQGTLVSLPPNAVVLVFDSRGVIHHQGARLPFYPLVFPPPEVPAELFAAAEALEFREEDLGAATTAYRRLASTSDDPVRAAALVRLARSLRKQGHLHDALEAYGELAAMGKTRAMGSPAELLALRERLALLEAMGDGAAGAREAEALGAALWRGDLEVDRATFYFYLESAQPAPPPDRLALAEAVAGLWPLWQQEPEGWAAWEGETRTLASVWRRTATGTAACVIGVDDLMASTAEVMRGLQVSLSLEDPTGRPSWGSVDTGAAPVVKTFRETGLPWTIHVVPADPAALDEVARLRRNLLSAGFAFMVLVLAAASFFVYRAVNREVRVARLQSDFVAAVSHEFRTPLTAMRHLTEMLEEGGAPGDRLPTYYRALAKETRRLHSMVEDLLDFGRMEAGQRTYEMVVTSAAELARHVVDEFREQAPLATHRVELEMPDDGGGGQDLAPRIRADREALALALRNLLDNAVKYSPESSTVRVSVESRDGFTGLSVTDQGPGIPRGEQQNVFHKFVRGTAGASLDVKGTGIGLAMADRIARAHGGRIELSSDPGQGSRFTILLPTVADHTEARNG